MRPGGDGAAADGRKRPISGLGRAPGCAVCGGAGRGPRGARFPALFDQFDQFPVPLRHLGQSQTAQGQQTSLSEAREHCWSREGRL